MNSNEPGINTTTHMIITLYNYTQLFSFHASQFQITTTKPLSTSEGIVRDWHEFPFLLDMFKYCYHQFHLPREAQAY